MTILCCMTRPSHYSASRPATRHCVRSGGERLGIELYDTLRARLAHPAVGFVETFAQAEPLSSNSHMHLLEASLVWLELDEDPRWRTLAEEIIELAMTRLIDARTGALPEFFTADWRPQPDWVIEPGHQFEWAWLLLRLTPFTVTRASSVLR